MALADLLWACPACSRDRALREAPDGATCPGCGTSYDRVLGARIRARSRQGEEHVRTAAEWVDALPDPATLLEGGPLVRAAQVRVRFVTRHEVVRENGRYLNRIEIFGPEAEGRLELDLESLRLAGEGEGPVVWAFGDLKAVQASSKTLQVRGGGHPLASFSFLDDSSFLWEQLFALALGRYYRETGRGEIVELQPRIVVGRES